MSSCLDLTLRRCIGLVALFLACGSAFAQVIATPGSLAGIGRPATAKELAAWDIDVRPDFKGLPKGAGSVAAGTDVWESKCASCHGIFGESNEVFSPLVGGTTKNDVKTGRVARLTDESFPGRTTLMKVPTLSTLWDYINRAMPWNAPKSLTPDEVYGVVAYLLNLGGVVPDNFTLSDKNMAEVQKLLPNRNGMSTNHGLWPGRSMGNGGRPDVRAVACMRDCATEPTVKSFLPDHARNAHGNLAEQNRLVGAQHGADTTVPAGAARAVPAAPASKPSGAGGDAASLFKKAACNACHNVDTKLVGPGLREIAKKHAGRPDLIEYLSGKIVAGGIGVWGQIPMPAQAMSPDDAKTVARWIADGAK
jgi:S-disulfanyl-L-cysteine oxidoreductase SoxD